MDIGSIRYGPQIVAAATAHNIDPTLLAAVAAQETGGPGSSSGSNIVGDGGHGHGVFQIDDRSWDFAKSGAAMDPAANANFAAGILADNLQRYGGNVMEALSAYNSGSPTATGTTTTWADGQTLGYAASVMRHAEELGGTTTADLTADSGENLANVNSLANLYSSQNSASNSPYATASSASSADAAQAPAATAYTPIATYNQLSSSSQQLGASTVNTMVNLMDEGDVFSSGDDDDS